MIGRINIYFRNPPQKDRFIFGDRWLIPFLRKLIKGKKIGGVEKVFINLCKGLKELDIQFSINQPFDTLQPTDRVIVLGNGKYALEGYKQSNKIIAGIGLMTHPSEWPNLLQEYPVVAYLQHSDWANEVYQPYYGVHTCKTWFAGIETDKWIPSHKEKKTDVLIYNKIRWNKETYHSTLVAPIKQYLEDKGLSYEEIIYGSYLENDYHQLLKESKCMLFLCEHESQGFACCEALSMNIPVLAWDQGYCLDPNRFEWGDPEIPATSVPFFDERCGDKFKDLISFNSEFDPFFEKVISEKYQPRNYILENLTLAKSAERMLAILAETE